MRSLITSIALTAASAILLSFSTPEKEARPAPTLSVVADSLTGEPLANASIFNSAGKFIGLTGATGKIALVDHHDFPITIRYIGFIEKNVSLPAPDTIRLQENPTMLPEVTVISSKKRMLHILAYMREFSTLATYSDTVALFREKMVDFMLPEDPKHATRGWRVPRVLNSRSYFHFTNADGLDSVSNKFNNHFTWSDWIGVLDPSPIPSALNGTTNEKVTLSGKYSPTEVWHRRNGDITVDINVLADSASRKWVPLLRSFFRNDKVEFDRLNLRLSYSNVADNTVSPLNLSGYSFNIESRGRAHDIFRFNRHDQPYFVSTYTEVYLIDKEFITLKEAKKWADRNFSSNALPIVVPMSVPELGPQLQAIISRVNMVDEAGIRLALTPDHKLVGSNLKKPNFGMGHRAWTLFKELTGLSAYKSHKHFNKNWRNFRRQQMSNNMNQATDSVAETQEGNPADTSVSVNKADGEEKRQ